MSSKYREIRVPADVYYISDWLYNPLDIFFKQSNRPETPKVILDKKVPGCGFTHWCLTNEFPVILCSPRKMLLENKAEQLGPSVFYIVGSKAVSNPAINNIISTGGTSGANINTLSRNFSNLGNYLINCQSKGIPPKILVTYDSYRILVDILKGLNIYQLKEFNVIVDEFQSIFIDSGFKGDIEKEFLDKLCDKTNLIMFVSATPMIERYMDMIPEFSNENLAIRLRLDWETESPGRVQKSKIRIRKTSKISRDIKKEISQYREGKGPSMSIKRPNGIRETVQSKELVIFVNSVTSIINIIKNIGDEILRPEEVNIICSDTPQNKKEIRNRLGPQYTIGRIPLRGEPHKMFTLCTSTAYFGTDFYSTNARSIIIVQPDIRSLTMDLVLDLPQILGRQRLSENPWANEATLLFCEKETNGFVKALKNKIEDMSRRVDEVLILFNNKEALDRIKDAPLIKKVLEMNYAYASLVSEGGNAPVIVQNDLIKLSDLRATEILEFCYSSPIHFIETINHLDNLQVVECNFDKTVNSKISPTSLNTMKSPVVSIALNRFKTITNIKSKLKFLKDELKKILTEQSELDEFFFYLNDSKYQIIFYEFTNSGGMSRFSDSPSKMIQFYNQYRSFGTNWLDRMARLIYANQLFKDGEIVTLSEVKMRLSNFYKKLKLNSSVKALEEIQLFYEVKTSRRRLNGQVTRFVKILHTKFA